MNGGIEAPTREICAFLDKRDWLQLHKPRKLSANCDIDLAAPIHTQPSRHAGRRPDEKARGPNRKYHGL